jgi:UDP-N-acetylmuramyl pentapeptide phosphotransferase/UDP-N-acetylglucosamine-1-phosphate transferase
MQYVFVSLLASFLATLWIIHWLAPRLRESADHDVSGVQKFHAAPVPRIGGVAIVLGIGFGFLLLWVRLPDLARIAFGLLIAAMPAFLAGLIEDLTKKVSPAQRLVWTMVSAGLAAWLIGAVISRTSIPPLDLLLRVPVIAWVLTVVAVAGLANAVNIIDGFNGLAAMVVVLMLAAIGYVAFVNGDQLIWSACLVIVGAILGFFAWNYPGGLIFLGDGGAYVLGFLVGELAILLVQRNASVSPWFAVLICIYPIFETAFSIYRKKVLRGMSPGVPDGIHLHMLVFKRLMRWAVGSRDSRTLTRRNSMTSPYLWILSSLAVFPAVLFWHSTWILIFFCGLFIVSYVWLYMSIVRFKAPRWLVIRKR